MYISGYTVQNKKTLPKLSSGTKLVERELAIDIENEDERPYSSEQKFISMQNHHSVGPTKIRKHHEIRNLSQNKITIKKFNDKKGSNKIIERSYVEKSENKNKEKITGKEKEGSLINTKDKIMKRISTDNIGQSLKLTEDEISKIEMYFRYLPISILGAVGVREEFIKFLNDDFDFKGINPFKKTQLKKDTTEFLAKLCKLAQLKGKYKYREKHNIAYSAQLKALDYKKKEWKKKKESSSDSDSDENKIEKCRDMATWKKSMGVDGKVFIIKGKYPDLRAALEERGWVENTDKKSTFFDLKWTTKISDLNFSNIKPNQLINHFDNNACLTSKYGLIKSVRSVMYPENMDIDRFFPKAFDLSDLGDFENFLEVYKWIYCESIIKKFMNKVEEISIEKLKIAIIVTERRLSSIESIVKFSCAGQYSLCTPNEWNFLSDKPSNTAEIEKTISACPSDPSFLDSLLIRLEKSEPQFQINGERNIWIAKPAFLSRGRGIKCLSNLTDILDTCLNKETQYVVQKYIENPLIISKRKFDIRVWVVVEDYAPPRIWFYNQFYLRFCLEDYNTDMLKNRYAHLTNNSVQKYNSKIGNADIESSMWDRQTFETYINQNYGEHQFKVLLSKMKEIVVATVLGTVDQIQGRRNSFEQMGYDMMIDENLNPWLIEVNSSPAMDYSTPITRRLVKMVMEDIVKIVVDLKKKKGKVKTAGEFKCIYGGDGWNTKYYKAGDKNKNNEE